MPPVIGAIGDLTVDILLPGIDRIPGWGEEVVIGEPRLRVGGNIGNMAFGAGVLKTDLRVISVLGDDEDGRFILNRLRDAGLDASGITVTDKASTSRTYACVRKDGERFFLTYPGSLRMLDEIWDSAENLGVDVIFFSGWCLPPRISAAAALRNIERWKSEGMTVAADMLWSDDTWSNRETLLQVLKRLDLFFLNEIELYTLTEENELLPAIEALSSLILPNARKICAVKLGSRGAALVWNGGVYTVDAYPATPIDTVGAGDLFNVSFLHAMYILRQKPPEALEFASTFASICISREKSAAPTEAETIESMLKRVTRL